MTSGINHGCKAASLMMHITETASGYFDNMWLWVADHMIEYVPLSSALGHVNWPGEHYHANAKPSTVIQIGRTLTTPW